MSHTFFGPLKVKNVAYLFSDRSRALAQAYVLKKVRRHSFYVYGKIKYMISQKSYIENPHGGGVV